MHVLGIALFIVLLFVAPFLTSRCEICGIFFKRNSYQWKIRNRQIWVCPNCNRNLERKTSRAAFDGEDEIEFPEIRYPHTTNWNYLIVLACLLVGGVGVFLFLLFKNTRDEPRRPAPPRPLAAVAPQAARATPFVEMATSSRPAVPMPTPYQLPREVALTQSVPVPVYLQGRAAGSITLEPGTRVQLVSVGKGSVVVRYRDSTVTVPTASTDLRLPTP